MHDFVPEESWIDAFQTQATHELRKKLKRFARARARMVYRAGGRVDDYYIGALVQDVLGDTLLGSLAWDHVTTSLEVHVMDAIRSRTRHDRIRAERLQHHSIDVFAPRAEASAAMAEIESSLSLQHHTPSAEALAFSMEVIEQLRSLADDDLPVLRILDAISAGAICKADIMHLARMSAKTYHKAHIRLGRLVEQLSNRTVAALRHHA